MSTVFDTEQVYLEGDMPGSPYPNRTDFLNTQERRQSDSAWNNYSWNQYDPPAALYWCHATSVTNAEFLVWTDRTSPHCT